MTEATYKTEDLKVAELIVDHKVQRAHMKLSKVERIKRDFNRGALGVIVVSRRADGDQIVLDGMHRVQAVKELTDATGVVPCHVFEGLSLKEEAKMFLDLNMGDRPTAIDKFKVSVIMGDPQSAKIDELVQAYGWEVNPSPGVGHIQAIQALEQLYRLSEKLEADPHLIQMLLLVVTRAWGLDRFGTQAAMVAGLGRFLAEYGSQIDVDRLVEKLKNYPGGPQTLLAEATQVANVRRMKTSMAVADQVTGAYNRGLRSEAAKLPEWRHRS